MEEFIREITGQVFLAFVWLSFIGAVIWVKISEFLERKKEKRKREEKGENLVSN